MANTKKANGSRNYDEPATDRFNSPVADPTINVKELNAAGIKAERDLREMAERYQEKIADLRAAHYKELRIAEAERINAIRAVDVQNVTRAAEVSSAQASALATAVQASAEALRVQVEATRITTADQLETA